MFIVVPYADLRPEQRRSFQFKEFVRHMREHCEILLQHSDVHIIISEQCMPKSLFNRGQLINLGIYWGVQTYGEPDKVIMHDVDLLPNPTLIREYSAPYEARMLLPNSETHKKSYGFEIEFGGAISGMAKTTQ
jgi:hypothetical protein